MLAFLTSYFKSRRIRPRRRAGPRVAAVFVVCLASTARSEGPPATALLAPPPASRAVGFERIVEADLRSWLAFLALPELEGRESGTRGYDLAARFCSSVFESFGVAPAGDVEADRRTYFQRFAFPAQGEGAKKRATTNVVGLIGGRDERLKGEYVVIGAHLDHVGVHDGRTYLGADDNASGAAGVLALARAFSAPGARPRRSILLVLYGAEEQGLYGSQHFVKSPPVPLKSIVAKLNLDMIGRDEETTDETADENKNHVHLVGARRLSEHLHRLIQASNRSIGLEFEYDEDRVYHRSDQYPFGEVGIPVAFFFTGFHPDYHKPSDTVDKINFEKMTRIVRLVYLSAYAVADLEGKLRRSARF